MRKGAIQRGLKNINLGLLGLIHCIIGIFHALGLLAVDLFFSGATPQVMDFLLTFINCLFYFYVGRSFLIAKNSGDFKNARYGIAVLIICDYVIPFIRVILTRFLFGGGLLFATDIVSLGVYGGMILAGVGFFVTLILEFRGKGKNYYIPMLIFGIILLLANIAGAVLFGFFYLGEFIGALKATDLALNIRAYYICSSILVIIDSIASVLIGIVFFLYPLYSLLRRKGKM